MAKVLVGAFVGVMLMMAPGFAQGLKDPRDAAKIMVEATAAGDADAIAALYAHDAVMMPPNGPAIHGRDAIRAVFERNFALGPNKIEFGNYKLDMSGSRANLIWNWRSAIERKDAESILFLGRSSLSFEKTDLEGWLIEVDMFQPGQYAPPPK